MAYAAYICDDKTAKLLIKYWLWAPLWAYSSPVAICTGIGYRWHTWQDLSICQYIRALRQPPSDILLIQYPTWQEDNYISIYLAVRLTLFHLIAHILIDLTITPKWIIHAIWSISEFMSESEFPTHKCRTLWKQGQVTGVVSLSTIGLVMHGSNKCIPFVWHQYKSNWIEHLQMGHYI